MRFIERTALVRRVVGDWALQGVAARRWPGDEAWVRALYRVILGREPEPDGLAFFVEGLSERRVKRLQMIGAFVSSNEFRQRHSLPPAVPPYLDAVHHARRILVKEHLPPAETIVDLGGASSSYEGGALLEMGYRHRPRQITIVDLPPDARFVPGPDERRLFTARSGVQVRWIYSSMTDLSTIPSGQTDLVWSGQSIEHVSEDDADIVIREAYRVLRPGGAFCLDTPNAALTRLHVPDSLIHPEHRKEYLVGELSDKLARAGFRIALAKAICPMPRSARSGAFDLGEICDNAIVSDEPELGYAFFLHAIKPGP